MASQLARAKLARAAAALNAGTRPALPALILMTDETRMSDPVTAARCLPKGSAIIVRHTGEEARALLAVALKSVARERGLLLLIAGDAALARRVRADGLHLPEKRSTEALHWRALNPGWLITAAAHSSRALSQAARTHADAAILAPVFPTASHRGRDSLGLARAALIARDANLPIYALGGIGARNVARLMGMHLVGLAAIQALMPDQSS